MHAAAPTLLLLAALTWPPRDVARFIYDVSGRVHPVGVAREHAYHDLTGDGEAELVAFIDFGRGFGRLYVVRKLEERYAAQSIPGREISLRDAVVDANGDGTPELLVRRGITGVGGGRPQAAVTVVYAFHENRWWDRSEKFAAYYRNVELPRLSRAIAAGGNTDLLQLERFKILRMTKIDRAAGREVARVWARDPSSTRRLYAISILADVKSPASRVVLQEMTKDRDREVAQAARNALK